MSKKGAQPALKTREYDLLLSLVSSPRKQSNKIFDKHDNCFTGKSFRELEELTGHSKSKIARLFKKLRDRKLIKEVINVQGNTVTMLSPIFLPLTKNPIDQRFKRAMYSLGSHDAANVWSRICREDYKLYDYNSFVPSDVIDFETGEVITHANKVAIRSLDHNEAIEWRIHRHSYSCIDRTKRRTRSIVQAA